MRNQGSLSLNLCGDGFCPSTGMNSPIRHLGMLAHVPFLRKSLPDLASLCIEACEPQEALSTAESIATDVLGPRVLIFGAATVARLGAASTMWISHQPQFKPS